MTDTPVTGPIERADVYKGDALAATLRRTPAGVEFAYLPEYLAANGQPVATTLPLTNQPQLQPGGGIPPFFAGLLPEGRRLSSLRRAIKTSADDDLSLLTAIGADTVGDVRVVPTGSPPIEPSAAIERSGSWDSISFSEVLARAGVIDSVGLPGVQDKLSLRMISVPIAKASRRYILKLDPPDYPHVVANEHYFLGLARRGKIDAARAELVHDRDGRPGLVVERFDRATAPDGRLIRHAVEDATQVLGRFPADKYNVSATQVVEALAAHCPARAVAVRSLFQQFVFAWLTGNGDQHAKNLAILRTDGEWRIAPMYDVPSTVPYGDTNAALSMQGRRDGFSRRRLLEFADAIGLPKRAAESVIRRVLHVTGAAIPEIENGALPFAASATRDLLRVMRFRRDQLQ